jgi:hypothetical protein
MFVAVQQNWGGGVITCWQVKITCGTRCCVLRYGEMHNQHEKHFQIFDLCWMEILQQFVYINVTHTRPLSIYYCSHTPQNKLTHMKQNIVQHSHETLIVKINVIQSVVTPTICHVTTQNVCLNVHEPPHTQQCSEYDHTQIKLKDPLCWIASCCFHLLLHTIHTLSPHDMKLATHIPSWKIHITPTVFAMYDALILQDIK